MFSCENCKVFKKTCKQLLLLVSHQKMFASTLYQHLIEQSSDAFVIIGAWKGCKRRSRILPLFKDIFFWHQCPLLSILSSTISCSLLSSPLLDSKNVIIFVCFLNISFSACFSFLCSLSDLQVRSWSLSWLVSPLFSFFKLYQSQYLLAHKIQ